MINFLCILCSLCIQFGAIDIPVYCPVNTNPYVESAKSWILTESTSPIFQYWADVEDCPYFVTTIDYGSYYQLRFFIPNSANNSSINSTCSIINYNNSDKIYGSFSITNFSVFTYYYWKSGSGHFGGDFNTNINMDVSFDYEGSFLGCNNMEIYSGQTLIFVGAEYVRPPDFPTLPGIGSLSLNGHSLGGSPLETLQNFSWSAHSSTYTQSGHNTHVNPSNATPDFSNATQNLLGQIVDNTNSIISNTNSLGGALETINGNIINGASALFNAISQLNSNFVSSVIIDKEELNDQWASSNTYLAFASMQNSFNLLQSTVDDLIDRYSATEDIDELIIPIDLTVWQISSSDYGNFKPFDEVYYMRFGFLDETKALWQPLFIALLYFCLFFSIVLDLPNIIRGAK